MVGGALREPDEAQTPTGYGAQRRGGFCLVRAAGRGAAAGQGAGLQLMMPVAQLVGLA